MFSRRPKSCRNESGRDGKELEDLANVGDFKIPKLTKDKTNIQKLYTKI